MITGMMSDVLAVEDEGGQMMGGRDTVKVVKTFGAETNVLEEPRK